MGEHKKYGSKAHFHTDKKKESKKTGPTEKYWWCDECQDHTSYDFNYTCNKCRGRMIWGG